MFSLFFLLGNFLWSGNLLGTSVAVAQSSERTTQSMITDKLVGTDHIGQAVLRIANMLLRPLLMISGWAMDNSMVYGSLFGFDAALWTVRNLTKNLANFFLAFLFVYTLLKGLFSDKNKAVSEFKKLITNTLIAGILIQSSWFLISAAVDISTIATYGV